MIHVRRRKFKFNKKIDKDLFDSLVAALKDQSKLAPVLLTAENSILDLLKISNKEIQDINITPRNTESLNEIFVSFPSLFYITSQNDRRISRISEYRLIQKYNARPELQATDEIELGEIVNAKDNISSFDNFIISFKKVIEKLNLKILNEKEINELETIKDLAKAPLSKLPESKEVIASKLIARKDIRNFLIYVKRGVLITDILSKMNLTMIDIKEITKETEKVDLTSKQQVVICNKNHSTIVRMNSKEELEKVLLKDVSCGLCGDKLSTETVDEIITITPFGEQMVQSSYWLTVIVLDKLINLGVNISQLRTNIVDDTGEIDIIFSIGSNTTLMELKDREFTLNDGYKLNARIDSYEADRAVVVATTAATKDAKEMLGNLSGKYGTPVIFIEELGNLENELKKIIAQDYKELMQSILNSFSPKINLRVIEYLITQLTK